MTLIDFNGILLPEEGHVMADWFVQPTGIKVRFIIWQDASVRFTKSAFLAGIPKSGEYVRLSDNLSLPIKSVRKYWFFGTRYALDFEAVVEEKISNKDGWNLEIAPM